MMHGREKSDPAIVAEKLTNKAERSAAESVERRVGAKGNAHQQSTGRAQNRATVSQALERIRQLSGLCALAFSGRALSVESQPRVWRRGGPAVVFFAMVLFVPGAGGGSLRPPSYGVASARAGATN